MKKIILFALAMSSLILTSCSKEEIHPTSQHQNITFNYSLPTALEFLETESDFSIFYDAIIRTKMDIEINGDGPYTIFAPDNNAMENFLTENNWSKIQDVPSSSLKSLVQFHLSKTDVTITDLTKGKYVPTLYNARELFIDIDDPTAPSLILGITKANVINQDFEQRNAMINKIDNVLSL